MSLTFFSVDVETSGLNPFDPDSHLLSIGATAQDASGVIDERSFYMLINRRDQLDAAWYDPSIPTKDETLLFWRDQDVWVRGEAWENHNLPRFSAQLVGYEFSQWVLSFSDKWEERVFMANPASFDFMWCCKLWYEAGVENPFHYHSLCLHSMAFGDQPRGQKDWTFSKSGNRTHRAELPHHPLSDAQAQALDFKDLL